jgi:hypothetical protein
MRYSLLSVAAVTLGVAASPLCGQASSLLRELDPSDLRSSSSSVFRLIQADATLLPAAERQAYAQAQAQQIVRSGAADPATQRAAIEQDIVGSLSQAAATRQYIDVSWRTAEGFRAVLGAGVGYFADRLPLAGPMLSEAGGQIAATLLEQWRTDALTANRYAVAQALRNRIAAYIAAGHSLPDDAALEGIVRDLLRGDLTNDPGEQSVLTREVLAFAIDEIRRDRQEINQAAREIKQSRVDARQETLRTRHALQAVVTGMQTQLNERIQRFGNALAHIQEEQRRAVDNLAELRTDVDALDSRMSSVEGQVRQHGEDLARHEATLREHSLAIAETQLDLDVLAAYTLDGMPLDRQVRAIERGDFDRVFKSPEAKQQYLEKVKQAQTVEAVLEASNVAGQLANALVTSGLVRDPRTARDIQTAVTIAQSTVQIGAGVYTGNPMMVLSGSMGLIGLFGHSQDSPEMQMYRQIAGSLKEINQNVLTVGAKVDSLRVFVAMAYEDLSEHMAANYAMTMNRLDHITYVVEAERAMLSVLLLQGRDNCTEHDITGPASYALYAAKVRGEGWVAPCLNALNILLSPRDEAATVRLLLSSVSGGAPGKETAEFEDTAWFRRAREFFCRQFALTSTERAQEPQTPWSVCIDPGREAQALPFLAALYAAPALDHADWRAIVDSMLRSPAPVPENMRRSLGGLYDAVAIDSVAAAFLRFRDLLEIADPTDSWRAPLTAEEFLRSPPELRQARRNDLLNLIENLRSLYVRPAQAQQVLISGVPLIPRMIATFNSPSPAPRDRELARGLLRDNPYTAHNFAVAVLRRVFHVGDDGQPEDCRSRATGDCLYRYRVLHAAYSAEAVANASKQSELRTWTARDSLIARLNSLGAAFQLRFAAVDPSAAGIRMGSSLWTQPGESEVTVALPTPEDLTHGIMYPPSVIRMAAVDALLEGARQSTVLPEYLARNDGITANHYLWLLVQQESGQPDVTDSGAH